MRSSRQLADAVEALAAGLEAPRITVMGHSQGGLVARKALIAEREDPIDARARLELVTISAPLAGIRAARVCGIPILRILSLGFNDLACWLISGDKWYEITDFGLTDLSPWFTHAHASWIPAFAGMTALRTFADSAAHGQGRKPAPWTGCLERNFFVKTLRGSFTLL